MENEQWKTFVYESSSEGCTHAGEMENCDCKPDGWSFNQSYKNEKGNVILKLHICRYCGASDNRHDPHIPNKYKNDVSYDSCSRCGFDYTWYKNN